MSDSFLSHFISGTFSVGLGNFSTMALGLLGTALVTRHLTVDEFGTFVLLQVVAAFLTQASDFGLSLSVPKFIASMEYSRRQCKLINTVIYFRVFTVLVVSVVALIAKPALSMLFGSSLSLVFFVPLLFSLQSLTRLLKSILEGRFLFKIIACADFFTSVFNILLILVFVLFFDQGVYGLIYAKTTAMTLACIFIYFVMPMERKLEFDFKGIRELLVFGFPLQVNDILTFVFLRIDTLLIGSFLGPVEIAYYEIARKIPDSLGGLYEAFRAVFFPFISKFFALGERKKADQMLNHSTRLFSFVTALGALIAALFGEGIISFLFSDNYLPSASILVLLMLGLNLSFINYTLGYSLVAVGDSDKPMFINLAHVFISLLGNFILIPVFGIRGAAFTILIGFSTKNPLNVLFLRRRDVNVKVGGYLKPLLIFVVFFFTLQILTPITFLLKVLIIGMFILSSVWLSVITLEDLAAFSNQAQLLLSEFSGRKSKSKLGVKDGPDRIFIVGCPRSGTTLLQTLVAAHSQITTFPESHFFERLFSAKPLPSMLGLARRTARSSLDSFLDEVGYQKSTPRFIWFPATVRQLSHKFVEALDQLTLDQGKKMWVEKTPGHVRYIYQIERLVDGAKFVHIVRNGSDVVASLYDIGKRYPELWGGYTQSIDQCIQRWIEDTGLSKKYLNEEHHCLIRYEELVADPESVLMKLCGFVGVPFEEQMLANYPVIAKNVVLENEPWKDSVSQPIRTANSKFCELFDEAQRQYIAERISASGLEIIQVESK